MQYKMYCLINTKNMASSTCKSNAPIQTKCKAVILAQYFDTNLYGRGCSYILHSSLCNSYTHILDINGKMEDELQPFAK